MSNNYRHIKGFFYFSILSMLLLTGCLPSDVNMKAPITQETPITNDGIVVARIINAGGSILPFNQLTLTPKDINASKKNKYPRLLSLSDPDGNTSLFASAIPPGEYSVDSARSFFVFGERFYSLWALGGVDLGVFNVVPGKVTDLGTFIYYRKVEGDKYSDKLIRVPQTNNQAFVRHYRPFIKYNLADTLTWSNDDLDTSRFSTYASLAQNPTIFPERYLSKNGSLFLLGKLGAVLERTPSGEWKQDSLDTNANLRTIAQSDNKKIIVGGDQGALFFKGEDGKWQDWSFDISTKIGSIRFRTSNEIDLYAVQDGVGVILRGKLSKGKPDWKKHYFYTAGKGWIDANTQMLLNTGEPPFSSTPTKSVYRIKNLRLENLLGHDYVRVDIQKSNPNSTFDPLNNTTSKIFSLSSDDKLHFESKLAGEMDNIIKVGKASIGVKNPGFWSMEGKNSYFHYDSVSSTWVEIESSINRCKTTKAKNVKCNIDGELVNAFAAFDFISPPVFVTPQKGYASVRPAMNISYTYIQSQKEPFMVSTEDGGQSWKKMDVKFPSKYCNDLVPEIDDRIMLYCSGISSDFYESTDEGKTWKHVRQQDNF